MAQFSQCKCALSLAFLTMLTGFSACTSKQPEMPVSIPGVASVKEADLSFSDDRIHFLNTGSSDAILLESDGHFAMVDAGEDTDNPRAFDWLNLPGFEEEVAAYLKAHAADENGRALDLFTSEFWEYWKEHLEQTKIFVQMMAKYSQESQAVEKAQTPAPTAKPVPEATPVAKQQTSVVKKPKKARKNKGPGW